MFHRVFVACSIALHALAFSLPVLPGFVALV
jgi:hypothetical protein